MNRRSSRHIDSHAGWAMAVGGMIGGGIYTLAGVILGVAGPLAWLSLLLGSLLALATVHSYFLLTRKTQKGGVPITLLADRGRRKLAGMLSWWLILVYVLAMGVYSFTFGHYVGRALGLPEWGIAAITTGLIGSLVGINLLGIKEPAAVQKIAVWIELLILAALAAVGFIRWNPQNLVTGVPGPSFAGVFLGMAATFIAFEGFEMLAYDYRELRSPRRTLGKGLAAAVIAVGLAYALVTVGAGSLVGAATLVAQKENSLAVAGAKAAGVTGLIIVTIAACCSAASAINSTLFSVSRLARAAAEQRFVPACLGYCNRRDCPHWSVMFLGLAATVLASIGTLETLVQAGSLAFLLLFGFVNALAFCEAERRRWLPLAAALTAVAAAIVVARELAIAHPLVLGGFLAAGVLCALAFFSFRQWRRRHRRAHAT